MIRQQTVDFSYDFYKLRVEWAKYNRMRDRYFSHPVLAFFWEFVSRINWQQLMRDKSHCRFRKAASHFLPPGLISIYIAS